MSQKQSTRVDSGLTGADSPEIGKSIDELTHFGHVRYAAFEESQTVWFDPRDGREYFTTGFYSEDGMDDLEVGEEVLTGVKISPYQPAEHGNPEARYVVHRHVIQKEIIDTTVQGWAVSSLPDKYEDVTRSYRSDVFDSLEEAREWCRENIEGYAEAPRRDAVQSRGELE